MESEKSRNGFYTVTFINKNNMDVDEISKEFSTVGNVNSVVQHFQRIFIRYKEKEEAQKAISKFAKYGVMMAKNKTGYSYSHNPELGINHNQYSHNYSAVSTTEILNSFRSMEELTTSSKIFHLILGNLPKNYTVADVTGLVAEAKPVNISQLDETRVFNIKFCHIILNSSESLTYLIDKLNGFVICGEKLIAAEAKSLLEWKGKSV